MAIKPPKKPVASDAATKHPVATEAKPTPPPAKPIGNKMMVRDYWPRYRKYAISITVLMQLAIIVATGLSLMVGGAHPFSLSFIVVIVSVAALTISLNIVLVNLLLAPLQHLTSALTHVSGEATDVVPPNPNAHNFERDGFKPLLDLIYQLSSAPASKKSSQKPADASLASLETAINRTKTGIVIMSGSGEISYASPDAPVVTNNSGVKSLQLIFDSDPPIDEWLSTTAGHLVRATHNWRRIPNRLASDPKRRIYDIAASYEQSSDAEVVLVFTDRTETYQPEDDQLDFISFAAHELRGPVTVIRGYLDVLAHEVSSQISPTHRALIDRLTVSANRLSTYINNILNASRYDRRTLKLHLLERRLSDIYHSIADDMSLRAKTQNRLLSVKIPKDLPTVAADSTSISEVLANLIDNALKYSYEGGVVQINATADNSFVRVSVVDHGIGMPPNVLGNLFHKFYRSHRSRETVAGTGIGLYICKAIIESHGGIIEAKSEVGRGSTFTFSIPIYATVADKLAASNHTNEALIRSSSGGWIKNHAKIRG